MASRILVVGDDVAGLRGLIALLRDFGHHVTGAASADSGAALLEAFPFDLLITDARRPRDRGLGLIRGARHLQPGITVLLLTERGDEAVKQAMAPFDVICLHTPIEVTAVRDILEEMATGGRQRRWRRKPVRGGFGAQVGEISATVIEMSYGGLRLEMSPPPHQELPSTVAVSLLPFGLTVNASLVWTDRGHPRGAWKCGYALLEADSGVTRSWRVLVDALRDS